MNLQLAATPTWIHHCNPFGKMIAFSSLFIVILFVKNINVQLIFLITSLLLLMTSCGYRPLSLLKKLIPFLMIVALTSLSLIFFGKGTTTWWKWGIIHITTESLLAGLQVSIRTTNYLILGLIFSLTTRPVLLLYSLMQQGRIPPAYAYSFLAAIRLIPIMVNELQTIHHAHLLRNRKSLSLIQKITSYSLPILVQSIRKAHRIAVAMEAKKFELASKRTYYYHITFSWNYDAPLYFLLALIIAMAFTLPSYFPFVRT